MLKVSLKYGPVKDYNLINILPLLKTSVAYDFFARNLNKYDDIDRCIILIIEECVIDGNPERFDYYDKKKILTIFLDKKGFQKAYDKLYHYGQPMDIALKKCMERFDEIGEDTKERWDTSEIKI